MFVLWGRRVRDRLISRGQFTCTVCRSQQRCARRRVSMYFCLYFIPLAETQLLREYLVCEGCKTEHPADSYADAAPGRPLEPVTWSCPQCNSSNPNHTFRCLKCGASLV